MRIFCFFFAGLLFAQQPPAPQGMDCHNRTLVLFVPGPNRDKEKDLIAAHLNYMGQQMKAGKNIVAGPFESGEGAAVVFASDKWEEVETILRDDPLTREGVIKVSGHNVWTACQATGAHVSRAHP